MEEKNDAQNYHVIVYCACWIEEFWIEMGLQRLCHCKAKVVVVIFFFSF